MSRKLVIVSITAATLLIGTTPVLAHEGSHDSQKSGLLGEVKRTVESTVRNVEDTTTSTVKESTTTVKERIRTQQEQIEARKVELREQMQEKVAERKEKLEGRRLAQCQNRQDNINALIDKSVSNGRERLSKIQRFEEGIKAFYSNQDLSGSDFEMTAQNADDKEAAAIAIIESIAVQEFDCTTIDGATPSDTIKSSRELKRAALKEYRDSVQQLLAVVRSAFTDKVKAQDEAQ